MKQSTHDLLIGLVIGLATVLLALAAFIWNTYRQIEPIL